MAGQDSQTAEGRAKLRGSGADLSIRVQNCGSGTTNRGSGEKLAREQFRPEAGRSGAENGATDPDLAEAVSGCVDAAWRRARAKDTEAIEPVQRDGGRPRHAERVAETV